MKVAVSPTRTTVGAAEIIATRAAGVGVVFGVGLGVTVGRGVGVGVALGRGVGVGVGVEPPPLLAP